MRISEINPGKRRSAPWEVVSGDGDVFLIPHSVVVSYGLAADQETDADLFACMLTAARLYSCRLAAVRLLAWRSRSRGELEQGLLQRNHTRNSCACVLDQLEASGRLDDYRTALDWATSRVEKGLIGVRRLRQDLLRRRFPREVTDQVLEQVFADQDSLELACRSARRKFASQLATHSAGGEQGGHGAGKGGKKRSIRNRIYVFLLSKGFQSETAARAVRRLLQNNHMPEDEFDDQ